MFNVSLVHTTANKLTNSKQVQCLLFEVSVSERELLGDRIPASTLSFSVLGQLVVVSLTVDKKIKIYK